MKKYIWLTGSSLLWLLCACVPVKPPPEVIIQNITATPAVIVEEISPSPLFFSAGTSAEFEIEAMMDVRGMNLSNQDVPDDILATLSFDPATQWSAADKPLADELMDLGMNPGMGIRGLHALGITGAGVNVAIIDQPMDSNHPEIMGKVVKYQVFGTDEMTSMHGPAVTSLLVGEHIGTAPGARVYFAAVPSWLEDARYYADALDWVIAENESLPADQKIRVVSVSAFPSGIWSSYTAQEDWDAAYQRALQAGLVVLDVTFENGITTVCTLDLANPDDVSACLPDYLGPLDSPHQRIFIPSSHRTTAVEGDGIVPDRYSYRYFGRGGMSWTAPYLAGVMALGWQINPQLSGAQMLDLLYASATVDANGSLFINPPAFIDRVRSDAAENP